MSGLIDPTAFAITDTITMTMRQLDRQIWTDGHDRHQPGPSHTLLGEPSRPHHPPLTVKRQRLVNRLDLDRAIKGTPLPLFAGALAQ